MTELIVVACNASFRYKAAGGKALDWGNGVAVDSVGRIVAAGFSRGGDNGLALWRYNVGGTGSDVAFGVAIDTDGKIVVVGSRSKGVEDDLVVGLFNP